MAEVARPSSSARGTKRPASGSPSEKHQPRSKRSRWFSFTKADLSQGSAEEEHRCLQTRMSVWKLLQDIAKKLPRMPHITAATSMTFFHRFFARQKLRDFDPFVVAAACFFLAAKVEDTPVRLADVARLAHNLWFQKPIEDAPKLEAAILQHELLLLQAIAFDMKIVHPHALLLSYTLAHKVSNDAKQTSWNFLNDCMPMTLCLRHTPNAIAAAAVVLGSRYCKETVPPQADGKPGKVWDKHVAESEIKEIINEILDFFDAMVGSQSAAAEPMPDSVAASPSSDASPVYGSAPASPLVVLSGPSAEPSRPARPQDASSSCGAPSSDAACPPPPPPPRDEPLEEGELELTASGSIVAPAAAASSDTVAAVAAVGAVAASVADAVPDASAPVADACAAASDAGSSASVAVGSPVVASGRLDSPVPDRRPLAAAESQTVVASVAVVPEAISVL